MADDLLHRYAEALHDALFGRFKGSTSMSLANGAAVAVLAVRDEELEQLRYERRLLGAARMVLDLVAAGDASRWDQARQGAEDVAQRIVDEIGHPVTDEPALGPGFRAEITRLRAELSSAQARIDRVDALHQPRPATEWRPCKEHTRASPHVQRQCGMCADRPTIVCSNITCCNWPCDAHLALRSETEQDCTHRALDDPQEESRG